MSSKDIKEEYNRLRGLGDEFFEMFPTLVGQWCKDKKEFTNMYNLNQDLTTT